MRPNIQQPIEARRGQVERGRSAQGGQQRVLGFIDVVGAGEALVSTRFPVWFTERPSMSFGGEMVDNTKLVDGNYPTVSLLVKSWETQDKENATYFIGASFIVVTTGTEEQRMKVHWQAEGKSLTNPTLGVQDTDSAI